MPNTKEAIQQVTKSLNELFKDRGQQLAFIGGNTALPTFGANTGTWQKSGKYPRYLLHVRINNGQVEVGYFPDSPLKGKLGWFNAIVKGGKGVPGVLVRLVLAFAKPDGTYELLSDWEWLVLLLFTQAQIGSTSAETLNNFLPPKPSVNITNSEVALSTVELLGLLPVDDTLMLTDASGAPIAISYEETGAAIQRYLTFDYTTSLSDFPSMPPDPVSLPKAARPQVPPTILFPSLF